MGKGGGLIAPSKSLCLMDPTSHVLGVVRHTPPIPDNTQHLCSLQAAWALPLAIKENQPEWHKHHHMHNQRRPRLLLLIAQAPKTPRHRMACLLHTGSWQQHTNTRHTQDWESRIIAGKPQPLQEGSAPSTWNMGSQTKLLTPTTHPNAVQNPESSNQKPRFFLPWKHTRFQLSIR